MKDIDLRFHCIDLGTTPFEFVAILNFYFLDPTFKQAFRLDYFRLCPLRNFIEIVHRCHLPSEFVVELVATLFAFLDILFKRQQQWIQAEQPMLALQGIAQQAGLSESDFVVCLKDQKRLDGIRNIQSRAADELGVRSTPTFFINGDKLEGNQPLAAFEKVLKPLLANARGAQ